MTDPLRPCPNLACRSMNVEEHYVYDFSDGTRTVCTEKLAAALGLKLVAEVNPYIPGTPIILLDGTRIEPTSS